MPLAVLALCLLPLLSRAQKNEKNVLQFDSTTKILTIEKTVTVKTVIDTVALYAKKARLDTTIAKAQTDRDSVNALIKQARKLMTGKKGGGGGNKNTPKAADAPPAIIQPTAKPKTTTKPKKDGKN